VKWSSWQRSIAWLLVLGAAWLLSSLRTELSADFKRVKAKSDAYLLPDVDQAYVASLGYRSALADLVYGHVLVAYGLHFQEKRNFELVGDYLDLINRLDPKFRDPYRFADTLITAQPQESPPAYFRKARQVLERGLKELPLDQELWSTAGQFMAYVAPARLTDPAEQQAFRDAGAKALIRACDLVGSNDAIPYHCITAANLLNQQGKLEAITAFSERVLAVNDDPEIQRIALGYLRRVLGEQVQEQVSARQRRFHQAWRLDMPFVPRAEISALGPDFDLGACAGAGRARFGCSTSWAAWAAELEAAGAP
jgi:hypothetical protein